MAENVLDVYAEYSSYDGTEKGRLSLEISSWRTKLVRDLKNVIQKQLKIPRCDQTLTYREQVLSDDSVLLSSLYLREKDVLQLQFLASGKLDEMNELISNLKEFAEAITDDSKRHDEILTLVESRCESTSEDEEDANPLFPMSKYDLVLRALENLAFMYFIPWKSNQSTAQRHYFVQEGGFGTFLIVFTFSHKRYQIDSNTSKPKRSWYRATNEPSNLERRLAHYNNEQQMLEMHCLSLLWNFSETSHDRLHAMRRGAVEKVVDALLLDPHMQAPEEDDFWVTVSLNETAVGCLVQYAEFTGTQEAIAKDRATVNKLITMVECRLHDTTTSYYSMYSSQIAANTLFCCASSVRSPIDLVRSGVHVRMIELTRKLLAKQNDMAIRYYCCIFLGRVLCCPLIKLDSNTIKDIDKLLDKFMSLHKPEDISAWEEKHNYVWITMVPFITLAFAGGHSIRLKYDTVPTHALPWLPGSPATQRLGLFCLRHMFASPENCSLVRKEKLLPYLVCLKRYLDGKEREALDHCLRLFSPHEPPALSAIAKATLALIRGFQPTLKM
ncbi:uncharacterized protein LOC5503878 [Nematostella vectensis]|uniref:uncharacterized protein LOC5503878 n=1 Tax=Nematostella vectensis TaxID=45351 RepID=UPI0020778C84|nr:uncharacterized protein LOC5503878 [Nematostella vectensis]